MATSKKKKKKKREEKRKFFFTLPVLQGASGQGKKIRSCLLRSSATSISPSMTCPHTRYQTAGHNSEGLVMNREYNVRLKPVKCVLGVTSGKFLRFMVNQRGIDANLDKIKVIRELKSP
ncbi:hypothetical protein ACOSQ3_016992 [Xanthoceras sorbifolium]